MTGAIARACVRVASVFVPTAEVREWREEWLAELAELERARASGEEGRPTPLRFAAGALPHALWMMMGGWTVDSVWQDLRYGIRVLRRLPGFTLVAAFTLALGIGANASIFSLVNGLVLKPPAAVSDPDRLVQVARSYEDAPRWDNFSWPAMRVIAAEDRAFSGVAGFQDEALVMGRGADAERVLGEVVTGNYFDVLGVRPHLGRLLESADDDQRVIVLGYALWRTRFGGDPNVVGDFVPIGTVPFRIVGIAPDGFRGVESIGSPPEAWVPARQVASLSGESPFDSWGTSWINLVARLQDGVTIEAAETYSRLLATRLREADPVNEGILVVLEPGVGLDPEARSEARQVSAILLLIVGLVLLLTCANVANLFLARASSRRSEVAVRMALGAQRQRLVRQLVTESTLVAMLATVLAVPMVAAAGRFLPAVFPYSVSVSFAADGRVYGFLVAMGLLTGLFFGAAPAWASSRTNAYDALREGTATGNRTRSRLGDALVAAQLALSLGLVTGTVLLGRSVANASAAAPGFQPEGLVAGVVDLQPTGRYDAESGPEFYRRLLQGARGLPGVRSVTLANQMPITGGHARASVRPLGREDVFFEAEYIVVGPDYFETLGIPIVHGRALGGFDDEPERVVVINQALAEMFWPGRNAVGQELDGDPPWRIVGVAGDVQMRSLRSKARPAAYFPVAHRYSPSMALHVASRAGATTRPESIRQLVAGFDSELPVSRVVDLKAALTASMGETRTIGLLVGAFALLALVLAGVGLYGLVSYGASQRMREVGIRIALGAEPGSLVRLIVAKGLTVLCVGILFGLAVSLGLGRALDSLLFGVTPTSLLSVCAAAVLLLAVGGLAAWVPARRASRLDAALSLREA